MINSDDNESELKKLINENRHDIFYSVFSTKISSHLNNTLEEDKQKKKLSNLINHLFNDKDKLLNIFKLFLDKSKYKKYKINLKDAEKLQYSLRFCIDADKISEDYNNIYYPLYCDEENISSYIPGNDLKERKIYNNYSKIKNYLETHPSYHGAYICICNIYKEDEEIFFKKEEGNGGYPTKKEKCKFCNEDIGNDDNQKGFYEREHYYRIFKSQEDLDKETNGKIKGNCITLEKFFEKYISPKIKEDSKGINISSKAHFDITDKPIRNQSQIGFRLMNLILYSHLFTHVLFENKEELFANKNLSYLDYILGNWNKLKVLLENKGINIYVFMNFIYEDLSSYLNKQQIINNYDELLKIEKDIENIIENKIFKKTEKKKDKYYSEYELFFSFYNKNKNLFRQKDENNRTTLIKQINTVQEYKDEKYYPYYKNFLYSDYLDINFFRIKLEEKDKRKYPIVALYLNETYNMRQNNEDLICFNFVMTSLFDQYSGKITKEEAKKLTFEKTNVYKNYQKISQNFIKIVNAKNKAQQITEKSSLTNFFINYSTEAGKKYIQIYKDFAEKQNNLLREIITKINAVNYDEIECQEINIQDAQKGDLLNLEFENESESNEIFLINTLREIYSKDSKVKYNNYNIFNVDFDKIEKIFEDNLIRNACFLKTNEIVEIEFTGEDFLNDGIFEFENHYKMTIEDLDKNDKKVFLKFYENNLKTNLDSCLEINEGLKKIITYINNNKQRIKNKTISDIIREGGLSINNDFKEFLENNINISINKLSNLMIYLEKLYFELAMEKQVEYKEKINEETKNNINKYYLNKNGQLITEEKLSLVIVKFLLYVFMNQKDEKSGSIELDYNLFEYLNNKYLWNNAIIKDDKFAGECEQYKKLFIYIKNAYDFYSYISTTFKEEFEAENKEILGEIKIDEEAEKNKQKADNIQKQIEEIDQVIKSGGDMEEFKVKNIDDDMDDLHTF